MHVEMAFRLAALGHEVHSYIPRREDTPDFHGGVSWHDLRAVDYTLPGTYILVRGFPYLSLFPHGTMYKTKRQRLWCVFQDEDESAAIWKQNAEHLYKVEKIIALCPAHQHALQHEHSEVDDKVVLSRNGIRGDLVSTCLHDIPLRQSHRLTYASSPDRGLKGLLQIFPLIRAMVPDAELHVCYGFDNMEKLEAKAPHIRRAITEIQRLAAQPGVILRGRLGQAALYREWLATQVMCAPTNFHETGYITLMEAQALGAFPIVNPLWAAQAYQIAGIGIEGDAEQSALTLRSFAMAAIYLLQHEDELEEIRIAMMQEARKQFDWQDVALQYDAWLREDI